MTVHESANGYSAQTLQARLYLDAVDALNREDWSNALILARKLIAGNPHLAPLHHILAVAALSLGYVDEALRHSQEAVRLAPGNPEYLVQLAQASARMHFPQNAMRIADLAEGAAWDNAVLCHRLSMIYARANAYEKAMRLSRRAVELKPENPAYVFNHATTLVFAGKMAEGEIAYEKVLALDPTHGQAHLGLAQLRKQTSVQNHIARLRRRLNATAEGMGKAYLHMALGKELEDVGEYAFSFQHLIKGKAEAGRLKPYDPSHDAMLFDALMGWEPEPRGDTGGCESKEPIFVMGMPRTGTTLIDRILSSHPDVQSAGELSNFGVLVKRASGSKTAWLLDAETVRRARTVDWQRLGEDYVRSTRPLTGSRGHFVDKLPHNFLYASMIAKALPNARIVCLLRDPLDTCLSNFRQLFSIASPYHGYSFDLLDTGRYYLRFRRLLKYWNSQLPGRILQVGYEALIGDQEEQTRRVLDFCQLAWDPACMKFEDNAAPVATASAVQVRAGLNDHAVRRWHRYAAQLQPLVELLLKEGMEVDQVTR